MTMRKILITLVCFTLPWVSACMPPQPIGGGGSDAGTPTFSGIYQSLLAPPYNGGCADCHYTDANGNAPGNLSFFPSQAEAYTQLVGVPAQGSACASSGMLRVDPGHPESSLLVDKIANNPPSCGNVMGLNVNADCQLSFPPNCPSPYVPAAQVEQIRQWILAGAPDN